MSEDLKELVAQIDNAILNLNPLTGYGEDAVWRPADKARSALITSREAITRLVGEVEGLRGVEHRVCSGCGSSHPDSDYAGPGKSYACCPERKMLSAKEWADRSDALSLRVGELEEGLRPFAIWFERGGGERMREGGILQTYSGEKVTVADFRQTSRLLSEGVSSATIDPVKVEAATPLAGQAEKYLALPFDRQIALADDLKDRLVAHIAGREKLDDEEEMLVNIAQVNMLLQHARHALSAPPLKGHQGVSSDADALDRPSPATGSDHGDQLGTTRARYEFVCRKADGCVCMATGSVDIRGCGFAGFSPTRALGEQS